MYNEKEVKLSELACKLSSMTFALYGCCKWYEGDNFDTGNIVDITKILYNTTIELFDLL